MRNPIRKHTLALALAGAAAAVSAQQIDGLQVNSDGGVAPGSTLRFSLEGTPRSQAQVTLNVNGGKISVPMREVKPGLYQGAYTVKRNDRIDPNGLVATRITTGNRWVATNFTYPQSFLAQAPSQQQPTAAAAARIERFTAASDGASLEPGGQVRFVLRGAPGGTATVGIPGVASDVRLREVNPGIYRGNYVIRRNDNLNGFASAAATLRVGNTAVSSNLSEPMTARVPVGTQNTTSMGAAAPTALPLQVLSPGPNAAIDGGMVQVNGRTAPGAQVRVRVDAVPPVIGNRLGVAQTVAEQTVQADANGNFTFNFSPQRTFPGMRYEVSMTANQGTQTAEQKLVLFQRG